MKVLYGLSLARQMREKDMEDYIESTYRAKGIGVLPITFCRAHLPDSMQIDAPNLDRLDPSLLLAGLHVAEQRIRKIYDIGRPRRLDISLIDEACSETMYRAAEQLVEMCRTPRLSIVDHYGLRRQTYEYEQEACIAAIYDSLAAVAALPLPPPSADTADTSDLTENYALG